MFNRKLKNEVIRLQERVRVAEDENERLRSKNRQLAESNKRLAQNQELLIKRIPKRDKRTGKFVKK